MMRCTDVEQLNNNNVKFFNFRNSHSFLQHVQCLHQRHHALKLLKTRSFRRGVQMCHDFNWYIFYWVMNNAEKRFSRYFSLDLKFVEIFCGFPVKKSKRSHCAKYSFLSINARKIEKIFESKILESMRFQFDFWRESSNIFSILILQST